MAKTKTAKQYEAELRRMIKARTGADMEPWLLPQVRATAANMVMLDKVQAELLALDELVTPFPHYALDTYLPKIVRAGHRVAICDQLTEK